MSRSRFRRRKQLGGYNPTTPAGPFAPLIGDTPAWGNSSVGAAPNLALVRLLLGRSRPTGMPVDPLVIPGITDVSFPTTSTALATVPENGSVLQQLMQSLPNPNTTNSSPVTSPEYLNSTLGTGDIIIEDVSDADFSDFPGIEEIPTPTPGSSVPQPTGLPSDVSDIYTQGPMLEQYNIFKNMLQEATTFARQAGSEGADVVLEKIRALSEIFKTIPASAEDILQFKMLVDKGTSTQHRLEDMIPHIELIRAKAREAVESGRINFTDRMQQAKYGIGSNVTSDTVANLNLMYNDLEVMSIVEPRYQYAAGEVFWLKELAKSKLEKGGEHARALRDMLNEYGDAAMNVVKAIPRRTGEMLSSTLGVNSQKLENAKDYLQGVANDAWQATGAYAKGVAYGDIPSPIDVGVDYTLEKGTDGVRWAQEQFSQGSDWAKAKYVANETMITFAAQVGFLAALKISAIFLVLRKAFLYRQRISDKMAKKISSGKIKVVNGRYVIVIEMNDGTTITSPLVNPDTFIRDAAQEGALMFNEPPLENSEAKLNVAQTADGAIVNAILSNKSEAVRRATINMMDQAAVGSEVLDKLQQASRSDSTIPVAIYKPPVTLAIASKKDPLRYTQDGRIGKVQKTQVKIPKTAALQILDEINKANPEDVQAVLSSSNVGENVASVIHANPVNAIEIIQDSNSNAQSQEITKALETIAVIPEARVAKDVINSSAGAEIVNSLPTEVQGQVWDLVTYSPPVELAKLMTEPNLNPLEERVQEAVQTLAVMPVAQQVKQADDVIVAAATVVTSPAVREQVAEVLNNASAVQIAEIMVQPAEDSLKMELKNAMLSIASEMSKIVTTVQAKDVKDTVEQIVTMQVAQNAVNASPEIIEAVVREQQVSMVERSAELVMAPAPIRASVNVPTPVEAVISQNEIKEQIAEVIPTPIGISATVSVPPMSPVTTNAVNSASQAAVEATVAKESEGVTKALQLIQSGDVSAIARELAKPESTTVDTQVKAVLQRITASMVTPAAIEKKIDDAKETVKTVEQTMVTSGYSLRPRKPRKQTPYSRRRSSNARTRVCYTRRRSSSSRSRSRSRQRICYLRRSKNRRSSRKRRSSSRRRSSSSSRGGKFCYMRKRSSRSRSRTGRKKQRVCFYGVR